MALGYDGKLYILAFDHRGSFQKKWFGLEGDPSPEDTERIADAKRVIYEGLEKALEKGAEPSVTGRARRRAVRRAERDPAGGEGARAQARRCRSRSPGQNEFDFQYGEDGFGEHIEKFDPDFSKVLVRYNPDGDAEMNERQIEPAEDARRLAPRERPQVPLRAARAGRGGAARAGRRRHRPLRRGAAARADAARDRGDPERRHRGGHLEDRGRRRALGRGDAGEAERARARAARTSSACSSAAAPTTTRSTTG